MEFYRKYRWLFRPMELANTQFKSAAFKIGIALAMLISAYFIFYQIKSIFNIVTKGDGSFRAFKTIFLKIVLIIALGFVFYYTAMACIYLYTDINVKI